MSWYNNKTNQDTNPSTSGQKIRTINNQESTQFRRVETEKSEKEVSHTSIVNQYPPITIKIPEKIRASQNTKKDNNQAHERPKTSKSIYKEKGVYRLKTETDKTTKYSPAQRDVSTRHTYKMTTPVKQSQPTKDPINQFYKSQPLSEYGLGHKSERYTSSGIVFVNEMYSNINRVLAKHRA